ncbi:MAG: hypothetical protein JWL86_747 [Rhizobium sp.]|nr:hypothetical protein [Rhizobium sp.]
MDRKKFEAIMALDGPERIEHTMKRIADMEELWGLYSDGWATSAADDDETEMFPIWPDPEYAAASAEDEWAGYEPRSIPLDTFLNVFLPNFEEEGTLVSIFRLPSGVSVPVTAAIFREIIEMELQDYL